MIDHLHIVFTPFPSTPVVEGLAVLAAVAVSYGFFRSARGIAGRAAVLALILLALTNPSVVTEKREPLKDIAVVAVDDSASMQINDRTGQRDRALDSLTHKLADFTDLETEIVHVKGREETDLFQALDQKRLTIPRDRLAGMIAVTDGEVHDRPSTSLDAPLHALITGSPDEIDRRLIIAEAPAYGIVGRKVSVTIRVEDQPKPQSSSAIVTFRRDTGDVQTLSVPVGHDVTVDVPVEHAGQNLAVFTTETLPHELTQINNTAAVSVNGIRDRLRVLLISGQPHIGGRTWRNFLKADAAVDLIHFTILRSPLRADNVPNSELALIAFPVRELFEVKLKSFDLVILDRFRNQSLVSDSYMENIAKYVENGGALLVSNATDDAMPTLSTSPLARVLPVTPTGQILTGRFVPDLTAAGMRHPVTSILPKDMPHDQWGAWYRQIGAVATKGDVLMQGINHQPLLVLDHVGQGRVAQFLSDQFWLWSRQGNGPEAELLRRVAHWLVQEPELDETAFRAHADESDTGWNLVIEEHSMHDTADDVEVTDPDGQIVKAHLVAGAVPGVLTATLPVVKAGLYHLKAGDRSLFVMAGNPAAPEFGAMVATDEIINPFVKASGGSVLWLADHPDSPEIRRVSPGSSMQGWNWIGLRKNNQYRITGTTSRPLMPPWLDAVIILAIAFGTWRREGKS